MDILDDYDPLAEDLAGDPLAEDLTGDQLAEDLTGDPLAEDDGLSMDDIPADSPGLGIDDIPAAAIVDFDEMIQIDIQTFLCRCRISASAYDADLLMSILDQFFHDLVRNTGTIRLNHVNCTDAISIFQDHGRNPCFFYLLQITVIPVNRNYHQTINGTALS